MAKTRAQRKAERRRRQQAEQRGQQPGRGDAEREQEGRAQEATREGVSGEVAEAEAVIQTGARTEEYGERTVDPEVEDEVEGRGSPVPGVVPAPVQPETEVGARPVAGRRRPPRGRCDRGGSGRAEGEPPRPPPAREGGAPQGSRQGASEGPGREGREAARPRPRLPASCWAELKRVQWPDRDTLVQASAVTFIFVAVMAAYLGALDAAFNWLDQADPLAGAPPPSDKD